MNDDVQIFIDLDPSSVSALESNRVDIGKELIKKKIGFTDIKSGVINMEAGDGKRTKDIVTIIIASAAALAAIGYAVSSIIASINYKTHTVLVDGLEELRDAKGEVLLQDGKPIYKPVKTLEIVNPAKSVPREAGFELLKVFKVRIVSK